MRIFFSVGLTLGFLTFAAPGAAQIPIDENHVQLSTGVIRVGTDIAYYENGVLKTAVRRFVPVPSKEHDFVCDTTKLKVQISPLEKESWPIKLRYAGKTLQLKPEALVAFNSVEKSVRVIAHADNTVPEGYKTAAAYESIFPGCSLKTQLRYEILGCEYRIGNNAILGDLKAGEDFFGVMMKLDLSNLAPYRIFIQRDGKAGIKDYYAGSNIEGIDSALVGQVTGHLETYRGIRSRRIRFCLADDSTTMIFTTQEDPAIGIEEESRYSLSETGGEETKSRTMPRWIIKRIEGSDYLIQLVSTEWLKQVVFPVFLRTKFIAGTRSNRNETFLAGNTYVIDGVYMVKNLTSLGNPGAPVYIKFVPDQISAIATAKKVKPTRIEHTIFTSLYDNDPRHGAVVDPEIFGYHLRPPRPGDYGVSFEGNLRADGFVRNCQIYYARTGLTAAADPPEESVVIKNVLLEHCRETGILVERNPMLVNCTVRNCGKGLEIVDPKSGGQVINCIFAENRIGAVRLPSTSFNNAWYANAQNTAETGLGYDSLSEAGGLTGTPFCAGTFGDCYLNNEAGGGALLKDSGYGSIESLELTDIVDPGRIDRGFHYPGLESKN